MINYIDDLRDGLQQVFFENKTAILIGEDVLDPYGGAFKVTLGLSTKYPHRVLTSPISEAGLVGVGAGLALRGYFPIIEIMFGDFMTLCVDQLINHASKFPLMYEGVECPLVVRTPMGGGRGYGPTHSQTLEKIFLGIPGLTIVAPSTMHRPGQVLRHLVNTYRKPTIFVENKILYSEPLYSGSDAIELSNTCDSSGFNLSILKNYKSGNPDVCIIAYGAGARYLPSILEESCADEINIMAIVPECIYPLPIEALKKQIPSCDRFLVIDENWECGSWAESIANVIYNEMWGRLCAPVKLLNPPSQIVPTSAELESKLIISKEKIESSIMEVLEW